MRAGNTDPDGPTCNILIRVLGEGGYFNDVVMLFLDMIKENVEPDTYTY